MNASIRTRIFSLYALLCVAPFAYAAPRWVDDLAPIAQADWNYQRAAHLLERAGFGGTPEEIARIAAMTPDAAVHELVYFDKTGSAQLPPFDHSGIFEEGLDPFPVSRPATTDQARDTGTALGVNMKAAGNRRMQPVVNKFFYWLRASRLETHRVAYWWANRMVATPAPLQEKMALFWHGHFATNEEKVRDYRKMLRQLELFQAHGSGNFRDLLIATAEDPAMLAFLDAGVNVKGAPNENFAREIMELFTMGVGNYSEKDIREAARAFTGWNYRNLDFVVNPAQHDEGEKTVLGKQGRFDGVDVIDVILAQPVSAEFIAGKLYRYFVREELSGVTKAQLGTLLRENNYELAPLLSAIFLSRDFYSEASVATHIKSPVELVVSTCRKLGLKDVPGIPDFNEVTAALGQQLLRPPTVAGWAQGKSWITPGLLIERGNFAREVLFPDVLFIAPDRYATFPPGDAIKQVHERIIRGMDISTATIPEGKDMGSNSEMMAMSNKMVDHDEDFNTRYASYRGWQMAIERVKPLPRHTARVDLTHMVAIQKLATTTQVVDYFGKRFLSLPMPADARARLIAFLDSELGTSDVRAAASYMEDPLRILLHLMLSLPEYQLG